MTVMGNLFTSIQKYISAILEKRVMSVLCAGDEFTVAELDTAKGKLKVGSMICYDREFPESARILMLKGAELVLVPNACPMELIACHS